MPNISEKDLQELNATLQRAIDNGKLRKKEIEQNDKFLANIGQVIVDMVNPVMREVSEHIGRIPDEVKKAVSEIKIVTPKFPDIHIPEIKIPPYPEQKQPQVNVEAPIVNIPPVKVPKPQVKVNILTKALTNEIRSVKDAIQSQPVPLYEKNIEYTYKKPIPAIMVDAKGRPMDFMGGSNASQIMQFLVGDATVPVSSSNPLPISGNISTTPFATYYASDAVGSVNVVQSVSLGTYQVSGFTDSVNVVGFIASVAANLSDSSGVGYSGSNPLPITGNIGTVTTVTGVTNSIQASMIDSSGIQYSGSNPLPITGAVSLSGSLTSTVVVGDIPSDTSDTGSAPIKIGGIARTTNPTAVADNDRVTQTYDDVGRGINRPLQVRDLIATSYTTLSNGTETTILTAGAGSYLDLIYVMGANTSNVAAQVDIRAVSAGNIMLTLEIPANGTAGISLPVPIPQDATGNSWTADMGDITNSNVLISALFSKEV